MAHFLNGFTVSQFISKGCYLLCGHKFRLWFRMLRDVWKNYLVDGGSYFCVAFCSCFEIYGGGDTRGWNVCVLNICHKNVGWNPVPSQIKNISGISSSSSFFSRYFALLNTKSLLKSMYLLFGNSYFYLMLQVFDLWGHNNDICKIERKNKEQKCVV